MKFFIIILFAALVSGSARGQRVELFTCAEKTAIGHSWNARVGLSAKYIIQPGVFFQSSVNKSPELVRGHVTAIGGYVFVALVTTDKMQVGAIVSVGLTNEKFVYVTPGFETRIFVTKHLALNVGAGYRYGYPSVSGGAGIRFLKK